MATASGGDELRSVVQGEELERSGEARERGGGEGGQGRPRGIARRGGGGWKEARGRAPASLSPSFGGGGGICGVGKIGWGRGDGGGGASDREDKVVVRCGATSCRAAHGCFAAAKEGYIS